MVRNHVPHKLRIARRVAGIRHFNRFFRREFAREFARGAGLDDGAVRKDGTGSQCQR